MDVGEIKKSIKRVIKKHRVAFQVIGASQTKLLELGAISGIAEHYASRDYLPVVVNPKGRNAFVVKTSTRGFPWNFSRIEIHKKRRMLCELHMNVMVGGAHGVGTYCVDVGIVKPRAMPTARPKDEWKNLDNSQLITFAEVKKLVVYPMLLAQFLGIVHEVKPSFLKGRSGVKAAHPSPMLIALGHYSANSQDIVGSYTDRGISVTIAANYDGRLARVRSGKIESPFDDEEEDF